MGEIMGILTDDEKQEMAYNDGLKVSGIVDIIQRHFKCYGAEKIHYLVEEFERLGIECYPQYYSGLGYEEHEVRDMAEKERLRVKIDVR